MEHKLKKLLDVTVLTFLFIIKQVMSNLKLVFIPENHSIGK